MTPDAAAAVLAAEDRRYQAMLDGDLDALDQLCADALSSTHSNGARDSKAEYFSKLRGRYCAYHRIDPPVERVERSGDAAVVVGRMTADLDSGGARKSIASPGIPAGPRRARAGG